MSSGWVQWCKPVILALKRLRQEDCCVFEASLTYIVRPFLKKQNNPPPKLHPNLDITDDLPGVNQGNIVPFSWQLSVA